jgi:hypothetical protein
MSVAGSATTSHRSVFFIRGNVGMSRIGLDRKQQFRFKDPMMQPYVIIRGIQNKLIPEAAKTILLQREQGSLPI